MGKDAATLAKLSRPRLYDAVPRERLFRVLGRARRHPFIWVSGPPEAGKTTLVGSWIEARRIAHRWYHIDAGDADPATFISYLIELAGSDVSRKLPYLTAEYLHDLPGFARRFLQGFFVQLPKRAVLVVDNAHEAAGAALDAILLEAANQVPPGGTLIVVSRAKPSAALARLHANRELTTVDWDDLRLTPDETTAIVRQAAVRAPPSAEDLHARTDGWAAGLLLASRQVEEALALLIAAGRFEHAAEVVENHAGNLLTQGRWLTLQNWIGALPGALVDARPWLGYWLGTSHIPIDQRMARKILARAYDVFLSRGDARGQLLSACGMAEAICLMLDDASDLDPWLPVLERLALSERPNLGEAERFRVNSSLLTGLFWRQSGHARLADIKAEVRALATSGNDLKAQFSGGLQIAQVANLLCDWDIAREIIDRNLPAIESGQCSAPMAAQWFAYVGYHHYVLARDALAWEYFRRSEQIASANGMLGTVTMVRSFWVYSAVACRDARAAADVLARMEEAHASRAFDKAQYHRARARLATLSRERTVALAEAQRAVNAARETGSPMMRTFWNSVVAGILAEFGEHAQSEAHLREARGPARERHRGLRRIPALARRLSEPGMAARRRSADPAAPVAARGA